MLLDGMAGILAQSCLLTWNIRHRETTEAELLRLDTLGTVYESGLLFFGVEWGLEIAIHCLFVV